METSSLTTRKTDLLKFTNGTSTNLWEVLGSHVIDGATRFSVWAPNAVKVYVNEYLMELVSNGIWEIVIPKDLTWLHYSYYIHLADGTVLTKFDPMSISNETHPNRKSIVSKSNYSWNDSEWMSKRQTYVVADSPLTIYEVHVNSWRTGKSYRDLAYELVPYVKNLGFTHVELMPVADHPFIPSWGYQITGFYAPSAYYGTPDDLRFLIDSFHQAGIGVILDWVGYHFARDDFGLAKFDGTHLYSMPEEYFPQANNLWGTDIFDYSKPQVRSFLVSNIAYWLKEFHIDAVRLDAVAPMIDENSRNIHNELPEKNPNWDGVNVVKSINNLVHANFPGAFTIGEETQDWPNLTSPTSNEPMSLGFDLKFFHEAAWEWAVQYLPHDDEVSAGVSYLHLMDLMNKVYREKNIWFISHDEVFHGCWGSVQRHFTRQRTSQFSAKLMSAYLMFLLSAPGKTFLFMGTELNSHLQWSPLSQLDWSEEAQTSSPDILKRAIEVYKGTPEMYTLDFNQNGLQMVIADRPKDKIMAFLRSNGDSSVLCVYNFSIDYHFNYLIPGLESVILKEIANSTGEPLEEIASNSLNLPAGSARWFKVLEQ